jgi:hypothetical protein
MTANSNSTPRKRQGSAAKSLCKDTSSAEAQPYEPTPIETKALAAFRAAKETRGPRLRVRIEGDAAELNPDHPDETIGLLALNASDRDR